METQDLLNERGKTHGNYEEHAGCTQALKFILHKGNYNGMPAYMCESIDMIAHKLGRICAGDPDFRDHWDDIAGYAKLVADRCSK